MIDHLNETQREIVTHFEGPMLVLAAAGSGKTRAITHRIAYLVNYYGVKPTEIVALTFTNKAAKEMLQRLQHFSKGIPLKGVVATTFHSFGCLLLRENAEILNINPNFQIIDDDDQLKLLKMALSNADISSEIYPPKKIRPFIDKWKNQGYQLDDFLEQNFYADFMKDIYNKIITTYEKLKEDQSLFDFGDLLYRFFHYLEKNSAFLKKITQKYKFILVDEYQDTNAIQYKILKKLALPHKNIVVVGDDDQSIYSFRGAEIRNILDFKKDFPEAKIVKLVKNYRSSKTIIDLANSVISKNRQRIEKSIDATKGVGEKIRIYVAEDERDEASFVLKEMQQLLQKGYRYKDIAIFYRVNVLSRRFEDVLRNHKIPYKIYGSIRFYNRKEIKDLVSFIRFLLNKQDVFSFSRITSFSMMGVGKVTIEKILANVREGKDIIDAINEFVKSVPTTNRITVTLKSFLALINKLEVELKEAEPEQLIDAIVELTAYKSHLRQEVKDDKEFEEKLKNIEELKIALSENKKEGKDYNEFLNDIILGDVDIKEQVDFVTLMTVHAAKGLEFPIVFCAGLEDGTFPHIYSKMENNEEEELRLFYVAITRAMERLYIMRAKMRNQQHKIASPFLENLPDHLVYIHTKTTSQTVYSDSFFNKKQYTSSASDKALKSVVVHNTFGKGIILNTISEGENPIYEVKFENGSVKKILGSFLTKM